MGCGASSQSKYQDDASTTTASAKEDTGQRPLAASNEANKSLQHTAAEPGPAGAAEEQPTCASWSSQAEWIAHRANEIVAAYNFFFEHIGLRKGWRTAPFEREEVQAPFRAAAEVVTIIRARLDEQKGGGVILRQLEGSAMNFLWGWNPGRPPGSSSEALVDFFRGLVFATLSDGRGLVEGLDTETVEQYVKSHPFLQHPGPVNPPAAGADAAPGGGGEAPAGAGAAPEAVADGQAATGPVEGAAPSEEPSAALPDPAGEACGTALAVPQPTAQPAAEEEERAALSEGSLAIAYAAPSPDQLALRPAD